MKQGFRIAAACMLLVLLSGAYAAELQISAELEDDVIYAGEKDVRVEVTSNKANTAVEAGLYYGKGLETVVTTASGTISNAGESIILAINRSALEGIDLGNETFAVKVTATAGSESVTRNLFLRIGRREQGFPVAESNLMLAALVALGALGVIFVKRS